MLKQNTTRHWKHAVFIVYWCPGTDNCSKVRIENGAGKPACNKDYTVHSSLCAMQPTQRVMNTSTRSQLLGSTRAQSSARDLSRPRHPCASHVILTTPSWLQISLMTACSCIVPLRPPPFVSPHRQHPLLVLLAPCQRRSCSCQQIHRFLPPRIKVFCTVVVTGVG